MVLIRGWLLNRPYGPIEEYFDYFVSEESYDCSLDDCPGHGEENRGPEGMWVPVWPMRVYELEPSAPQADKYLLATTGADTFVIRLRLRDHWPARADIFVLMEAENAFEPTVYLDPSCSDNDDENDNDNDDDE